VGIAAKEIERLEAEQDQILETEGPESESLMLIYDRLAELDPTTLETRAASFLAGLGI